VPGLCQRDRLMPTLMDERLHQQTASSEITQILRAHDGRHAEPG